MTPDSLAVAGLASLLGLLAVRVPVATALLVVGIVGLLAFFAGMGGGLEMAVGPTLAFLSRDRYSFVASFSLMAVPMFILMGSIAFHCGATTEAFMTARLWLSRLPGGLALASIVASGFFAAISGSSLATASAMGRIAVPEMLKYKYSKSLAAGAVAAGGTLGALIPPSILMVVYGVFTEQSVGKLLIAGLIPGTLTAAMYMVGILIKSWIDPKAAPPVQHDVTWGERVRALKGTGQFFILFVIVMGSIYAGIATPTEAAAVGAAGVLAIGPIRRRLTKEGFKNSFMETARQSAMIFAIAIGAKVFVAFIAFTGVAIDLTSAVGAMDVPPYVILLVLSLVYILLGMFMDPLGIMLLTLPVVIPTIEHLGYDLIWFGVIMVKYLEIGMITPPVGLNVFVLKAAVGNTVRLESIFRGILLFLAMDIITLALLIIFPEITLWLPNLM